MTQTIQLTRPHTFRVGINPKLLEKARNFFNASLTDVLNVAGGVRTIDQNLSGAGFRHLYLK